MLFSTRPSAEFSCCCWWRRSLSAVFPKRDEEASVFRRAAVCLRSSTERKLNSPCTRRSSQLWQPTPKNSLQPTPSNSRRRVKPASKLNAQSKRACGAPHHLLTPTQFRIEKSQRPTNSVRPSTFF